MPNPNHSRNPLRQVATTLRDLRERHGERHRPSGHHFAFADRTDSLNEAAWAAVAANGSLFLRRDVLRVMEQNGPDNVVPRYALVFRADQPVAAVAAQIVTVTGKHVHNKGTSWGARFYLIPTTIASGPTRGSTRVVRKPTSRIHSWQSAPV